MLKSLSENNSTQESSLLESGWKLGAKAYFSACCPFFLLFDKTWASLWRLEEEEGEKRNHIKGWRARSPIIVIILIIFILSYSCSYNIYTLDYTIMIKNEGFSCIKYIHNLCVSFALTHFALECTRPSRNTFIVYLETTSSTSYKIYTWYVLVFTDIVCIYIFAFISFQHKYNKYALVHCLLMYA